MDLELERLREACRWDINLIPKYMRAYERVYGKTLQLYPLLNAVCTLHAGCSYPHGQPYYFPSAWEAHDWKIEPSLRGIQEDLISWMGIPFNLFNTKKNILPDPVSSEQLLETFYSRISQYFGYEHVLDLIKHYYEHQLKDIVTIIAELKIPPKMTSSYPVIPISLEETIKLINLRVDLIERYSSYYNDATDWISRNSFNFCIENLSPLTIFSFSSVGFDSRHHTYATNMHRGVTFRTPFFRKDKEALAKAEFSVFG